MEYEDGELTSLPELAIFLCFFSGIILLALGLLQLGVLVTFVSPSVIIGFVSSAAITIPVGQLKKFFAVQVESPHFFVEIYQLFEGTG